MKKIFFLFLLFPFFCKAQTLPNPALNAKGQGTVTNVTGVQANGFIPSFATGTTTPALTMRLDLGVLTTGGLLKVVNVGGQGGFSSITNSSGLQACISDATGTGALNFGYPAIGNITGLGANNATVLGVDNSLPITVQVNLSSAQILALNTTPIQLVAAPGAGKIIVPISMIIDYTFGTTGYTGTTVQIYETTSGVPLGSSLVSAALGSASSISAVYPITTNTGNSQHLYIDNAALNINALTSNPTLGDGTAKITIIYRTVTR